MRYSTCSLAAAVLVGVASASPIYHSQNEHWTPEPAPVPQSADHWVPGHWDDQKPKHEEQPKKEEHWVEQPKHTEGQWQPQAGHGEWHQPQDQPQQHGHGDRNQHGQGEWKQPESYGHHEAPQHGQGQWQQEPKHEEHWQAPTHEEHWQPASGGHQEQQGKWSPPTAEQHAPTNKNWVQTTKWDPNTHEYIIAANVLTIRNVRDSVALASGDPAVFAAGSINDAEFRSTLFSVDIPADHGDVMCEVRLALANGITGESFATPGNRLALWEIKNEVNLQEIPAGSIRSQGNIERINLISKHVANLDGDSTFVEGEELIEVKGGTQLNFELVADAQGMNVAWAAPALNVQGRPVGPYLYCFPRKEY